MTATTVAMLGRVVVADRRGSTICQTAGEPAVLGTQVESTDSGQADADDQKSSDRRRLHRISLVPTALTGGPTEETRESGIETGWALVASVPRTSPASAWTARSSRSAGRPSAAT